MNSRATARQTAAHPPAHAPLAEAGTELIQFSPAEELRAVSAVMGENAQKMLQSA